MAPEFPSVGTKSRADDATAGNHRAAHPEGGRLLMGESEEGEEEEKRWFTRRLLPTPQTGCRHGPANLSRAADGCTE